ncbi:peptidoglycan-associated protein-like protein [uncultured phage cr29_1]|uniref:Peptidoglycan-associated protein-like protein n=1 Tax=uncultured phage cr29_1 TaxID=2986418 RepID=A0AAE7S3E2_9CAUD|nr:peptidoglycan-associated protein-like protein [uncultured phage cr29_1]
MELKQRKKINNIPKFNNGIDLSSSVKGVGGDITGLNTYKQQLTSVPTRMEVNGMRTPGNLSLSSGGGGISTGTVTGAVNGTIGMIQGYNSMQNAVKGTDELMAYSGQRIDQAFGVNYQAQNDINRQKAMDDISKSNKNATLGMVGSGAAAGAAIGSAIPGVGTLIGGAVGAITGLFGGLFGSKKARERQRRKIFNAQQKVNLINQVNKSSAATEGLTQQYYLDNGNTYDDVLYANRGKDLRKPRYVKGK